MTISDIRRGWWVKKILLMAVFLACSLGFVGFGEAEEDLYMYTIRHRQLLAVDRIEGMAIHKIIIHAGLDGYYEADESLLFKCYDSLQRHLVGTLDLNRCQEVGWKYDNVVFSFYEYYLQFIPYLLDGKRYIFINSYRPDWSFNRRTRAVYEEKPIHSICLSVDGGASYWRVRYDVKNDAFFDMSINRSIGDSAGK